MNKTNTTNLDPVLARVLARAFESTCAEMGSAMIRTAISAVFVEGRDFSCALLDPGAELVASANYDPSHLSAMALTGEYVLMQFDWEQLDEGDVVIVNDPYRGGGHLPDICVIRPVYAQGEMLGLAINRGHHIDVGGMSVAGFPGTAKSIYQEGVRIPPVKWFEAGTERPQVMDMILMNVRFPQEQLGDFRGQLASCITAEQRIRDLVERHGLDAVRSAMEETKAHSERLMRRAISDIPDGDYRFTDVMDDDGITRDAYRIAVNLRVEGDGVEVDFEGTSAQAKGPVNSSYGNTVGSVFNAFMHTFGAEIPFNHGSFRPISFDVPRGSMLNPIPPAPVFGGVTETSIRVIDCVFGALAEAVPDRVAAGCYGTCINVAGGGWDEKRNSQFGVYLFQEGGWGGTSWRDGWSSVPNPTSNFSDYPAEVIESTMPLRCVEFSLNEDSAGPGYNRGGFGTKRVYELLAESSEWNALGDRFRNPPHGTRGGEPGHPASLHVIKAGERTESPFDERFGLVSPSKFAGVKLAVHDRIVMSTGGGGGYGDPFAREPARVLADVREGLVSIERAAESYGVSVVDSGGTLEVDEKETERLRAVEHETPTRELPTDCVPASVPSGQEAEELRRVREIVERVRSGFDADNCPACREVDGFRQPCPFHHPFAAEFWEALALEQWANRNGLNLATREGSRTIPARETSG